MAKSRREFILQALEEDLGRGDLFERLIDEDFSAKAHIIAKEAGVFSGKVYICELFGLINVKCIWHINDGEAFSDRKILLELEGSYTLLLKLERVILNILQHSSGIATNTAAYLKELKGIDIAVLDTRKTRPLLRDFEKYSVRNGGAKNHRMGLDDTLMLKDTHLRHIQPQELQSFLKKARLHIPWTSKIEIECEDVGFAKIAMQAGADIVMCDNMPICEISAVVAYRDTHYPHILLEGSGNITKDKILAYAKSGVDAISVGSLIHQAVWIDMSMKMQ
ncbi:nicotinate-nucleotide diphosphorylase (carboxylating) [Helicobacter sp. 12S02634-8]|uniref:carboxylating nicotinate-nucleotide diphosphorylase n=1 Tax=Helicobacter sp. 12S02634-8 TaxID=1476199 RepID=UPI000BA5C51B|nr:carboxylating nicotinate-nucleotide diphosphorylase [Helicobacter sp. 12S02634-8]PAF47262.1 nicotinate-nucleotide diphosphorylase (carboxylating) [Helicobacter sp. 12S02634-8]